MTARSARRESSGRSAGRGRLSAAFLDYDDDGWLDLYVSCYGHWAFDEPHPFCGDEAKRVRIYCPPSMIQPDHHFLFRNRGDGTFEETTTSAGRAPP